MRELMLILASAAVLPAQTAGSAVFRAILLPSNEVPPVAIEASGAATVRVHYVRDAAGEVMNGSVDFAVSYNFPEAETVFTGLHIHRGAAGTNGPVLIDTGITGTNNITTQGGRGSINRQAQVTGDNAERLAALRDVLDSPSGFYVNLHTTTNPGGVIRGQLQRAEEVSLFGQMSPRNEVPPIEGLEASGLGFIHAIRSFNESGAVASGVVTFDVAYTFPGASFTGLHIHRGAAGVNGPVIINSGISGNAPVAADPSGSGRLNFTTEVDVANANQLETLNGLFFNPSGYYVNLHTTTNPGGAIRAQLRPADRMHFPVTMSPANEVPPIADLQAQGIGFVDVESIRDASGAIEAARVTFDVNFRFPAAAEFTGLHIHNGAAGTNGPVTVNSGIGASDQVSTETGFGNITRSVIVSGGTGLETLNSMVSQPENHYVNLHTAVNPGGAVRAPAGAAAGGPPTIGAAVSGVLDPERTTLAPNSLFTIFGSNLARVATSAGASEAGIFPSSLNGVSVTIGGKAAPLLYVASGQINAVVPVDAAPGSQGVVVTTAEGASAPMNVTIEETAPAIFFAEAGGIVVKNSDFSLISEQNPAAAGDILVIYATGLGQTTPPQETGKAAPLSPLAETAPVSVNIGGADAEVIYSIASPGYAGLYQVAVEMPAGVSAGNADLFLLVGPARSNTVKIVVR
jgi:uncharacterized protein (TIGR03437 family)